MSLLSELICDSAQRPILLLHSGRFDPIWARQSLIASPLGYVRLTGDGRWESMPLSPDCPDFNQVRQTDPWETWRSLLDFPGRWFGYVSYDLGRWLEGWKRRLPLDERWPLVELAYCPDWSEYPANERLSEQSVSEDSATAFSITGLVSDFSPSGYQQTVQRVKDYIAAGDVYQVNLSQRFTTTLSGHQAARRVSERLLRTSPAWYGACLEFPDWRQPQTWRCDRLLTSVSPELFFSLDSQGKIITRPIKGTRPASVNAQELRDSPKDQAELNMIVDLLRNDLGRVASTGTVQVVEARRIESHPMVHHGVATIAAELKPSCDLIDLLQATLPGGSVTGAPKIRAMQIIDELEPVSRGPYCGAIGWMQGRQAMLNIAIRTLCLMRKKNPAVNQWEEEGKEGGGKGGWEASYHVGGGIIADSDPAQEYQETLDKAQAIRRALEIR